MLKIAENGRSLDRAITLRLQGRVIGPWVQEVHKACAVHLDNGRPLRIDLAEVQFMDREGIRLFQELLRRQVLLINCPPFITEQLQEMAP